MNAPTVSFVRSKHAAAILSYSCSCPNLRAKKASPQKIRAKIATVKGIPVNPIRFKEARTTDVPVKLNNIVSG